ncbi:MAG: MDR family MFS transporter [Thermomicrobiales bacterium]
MVTAYLLTSTAVTPLWGKVSDIYGRRIIFQLAITIFIIGSALCGLAQDLPQLIAFRALQGIGGGGLFSIAFAIVGDIIPLRDRGRYQGYFGAVFGLSSVAGPLLGGYLTDAINWRWIFYINLPVGIAALIITSMALKLPVVKREHSIDYLGATLIVAAVSSLLLYLNWAGERYGWQSAGPVALGLLAFVFAGIFIFVEMRAREPIIPLRLFRNSVFSIGTLSSFLIGLAMFGALVFLPLYFQAVKGMSPTRSGLATVPTVIGIVSASIISGQLISKTGRYKIFPIVGAAIFSVALLLMSTIGVDTAYPQIAIYAFMIGIGLGLSMQTVTTAVQNSVEHRDMGAATSSVTFSRSLGGAIGTAFLGAIFGTTLARTLENDFSNAGVSMVGVEPNNIDAIQTMSEPIKGIVLSAYAHSIDTIFLWAAPFAVGAFLSNFGLKELTLRTASSESTTPIKTSEPVAGDD